MRIRRVIFFFASVFALASSLVACGGEAGQQEQTAQQEQTQEEETTLAPQAVETVTVETVTVEEESSYAKLPEEVKAKLPEEIRQKEEMKQEIQQEQP
jgi:hypothetical protein